MRTVTPDLVWIGNASEARDIRSVVNLGITAVVDLAYEESPIQFPRDIVYCRFPLVDGVGNKRALVCAAIETIAHFLVARIPTLVACGAGMSRSPAILAAAIVRVEGIPLVEALQRVIAGRPHDVSSSLLEDIIEICGHKTKRQRDE